MSEDFTQRLIGAVAKAQHLPPESVTLDKTFEELKIDSLDMINILFALENEFNIAIPDEKLKEIPEHAKSLNRTPILRDLADGVEKLLPQ